METTTEYTTKSTLALGIDPGLGNTGYAFILKNATSYKYIESGLILTPPNWSEAKRLLHISDELQELLKYRSPTAFCVEGVYFQKNRKTAMSTAKVIGICLSIAKQHHIQDINEARPQDIKAAITGNPRAKKKDMIRIAPQIVGLKHGKIKTHHEADAIGAAVVAHMLRIPKGINS